MVVEMFRYCLLSVGRRGTALMLTRADSTSAAVGFDFASAKSFDEIPGPRPLPLVGNTWRFMPFIGEFHNLDLVGLQEAMLKKYGKVSKITSMPGKNDMVFVFKPEDAEAVFRNEGNWPIRVSAKTMEYYRSVVRKDFYQGQEGVVFTQGKKWQDFRTKVNQPMMQPRSAKLYVTPINDVAEDFIIRMRKLRNRNGELPSDFIQHMHRWALESISVIALDTRLGCLEPNLPKDSEPQKMIDAVQVMFQAIFDLDVKPNLRHFTKYKIWDELVVALDIFNEVSMKYIEQAMIRIMDKPADDTRELSILERLLLNNENPKVACVMALDMLFAGIDTTSNATAILLHYLARNPDKQQKLFEEIITILPNKDDTITAKNIEDMKYMKACIKESMRLTPIVASNIRETVKDIVLSNYHIPKEKDLIMCHMQMSNSEENFSQPDRFIPERWIKGDNSGEKNHPFVFLPFGFGPRMCVGRRFAELEMQTLTAKVIRNFRIDYDVDLKTQSNAVNQVVSPLTFNLEDRP